MDKNAKAEPPHGNEPFTGLSRIMMAEAPTVTQGRQGANAGRTELTCQTISTGRARGRTRAGGRSTHSLGTFLIEIKEARFFNRYG
jgi:hypothetical protein